MGMDVVDAYRSRDEFIRKNELSISLKEILQIRDASIVFYTKEIGKIKSINLSPFISSVIQYIGINVYNKITVKDISDYFSISETKLRRNFKNEMNISVYNYIIKKKIDEAKVLLKSNYTISEISYMLDFSNPSHFSKVFKKNTGHSPKKFRQIKLNSI